MVETAAKLRGLLEPPITALGYELVHIEFVSAGKERILRLYIDAPGGIRVDDCESVSRQVSMLLDVEEPLPASYALEVSSPGLDRPLVTPQHFRRFIGSRAMIVMHRDAGDQRCFTGELLAAEKRHVVLEVDGERHQLAYHEMNSARLKPVF